MSDPGRSLSVVLLVAALLAPAAAAQQTSAEQGAPAVAAAAAQVAEGPQPSPLYFVSTHTLDLGGSELTYRAVAETTLLRNDKGEPDAEFFSISYLDPTVAAAQRPITFAFNGGPGSSSIWLHMGLLGPKLVQVPSDGQAAGAPPYPLVDNPHSLLAVSDLVFIDPIGTGLSRVVGQGDTGDHWGVDEDARSVARFIRRYLSDKARWASPKYILGESYGGIRGPLLVRELQGGFNSVALNGLMLISPALDMEVVDGQDNDAAYATVLPTYAATAWFHDALPDRPAELEPLLDEVRRFVRQEYVPALFAGRALGEDRYEHLVASLHQYTGLSPDYLRRAHLKVSTDRFRRELLRERGLVVGRLDTRYTGTEADDVGEVPSGDPMGSGISGAYVAGFLDYLHAGLGVSVDRDYVVMCEAAGEAWKRPKEEWSAFQGYVDVAPVLARGMAENPALRVLVASGLYDIATTFFAAETNVQRSTMDLARVELHTYPAGHMMYVNQSALVELAADLRAFVAPVAP